MSREIVVRNYRTEDLEHIKEILSEYTSPTDRVWNESMVKEMMSDALRKQPDGVFVAVINGKVVGFAIVMYRGWFSIAYLDYIKVKTAQINKGVGHRLIEKCLNWAREKSARMIYTETGRNNERVIKFYQRHGFKTTGNIPDYYKKGLDAVILTNIL